MVEDYYKTLGVDREASEDDIKKAYHALAVECHPDLHPENREAKEKFQRIQRAFYILGDSTRRAKYNRTYDAQLSHEPAPPPQASPSPESSRATQTSARRSRPRRTRSPFKEVVKVILGGIAGIALAGLILHYGLGIDSLGTWGRRTNGTTAHVGSSSAQSRRLSGESLKSGDPRDVAKKVAKSAPPTMAAKTLEELAKTLPPKDVGEAPSPMPPSIPPPPPEETPSDVDADAPPEGNDVTDLGDQATDRAGPSSEALDHSPDARLLERARALAKEVFASRFDEAKKTNGAARLAAMSDLAKEMVATAEDTTDPSARLALLESAANVAYESFDTTLTADIIDSLVAQYGIDGNSLRLKAIERWTALMGEAKLVQGAERTEIRRFFLREIEVALSEAVSAERYDLSVRLCQTANDQARVDSDKHLAELWSRRLRIAEAMQKRFENVKSLIASLESSPDDANTNVEVAAYYCIGRGDWAKGMPYLSDVGNSDLRSVVEMDRKQPTTAGDQVRVGDAWWELSSTAPDQLRELALVRAGYWYGLAVEKTKGLERKKLETRLEKTNELVSELKFSEASFLADGMTNLLMPLPNIRCVERIEFTDPLVLDRFLALDPGKKHFEEIERTSSPRRSTFGEPRLVIDDGELLVCKVLLLMNTRYSQIFSVSIRGRTVQPITTSFRFNVGPVDVLLNWEVAKENHFRYIPANATQNVASYMTRPPAMIPGRWHNIDVRADGADVVVTVDGTEHFRHSGDLNGTLLIKGNVIAIQRIVIDAIPSGDRVNVPSHLTCESQVGQDSWIKFLPEGATPAAKLLKSPATTGAPRP